MELRAGPRSPPGVVDARNPVDDPHRDGEQGGPDQQHDDVAHPDDQTQADHERCGHRGCVHDPHDGHQDDAQGDGEQRGDSVYPRRLIQDSRLVGLPSYQTFTNWMERYCR